MAARVGAMALSLMRSPSPVMTVVRRRRAWVAALMRLFFTSAEEGAETSVYLACDPDAAKFSGEYFYNKHVEPSSPASKNLETAYRLYNVSLQLAGLENDPLA